MKLWGKFSRRDAETREAGRAWISGYCAWLSRFTIAPIAIICPPIVAFLSWMGIKDVGGRDIGGIDRGIVPPVVGWPCPERGPGGPAKTPAPAESPTPTAAAPTPSPVPARPSPAPTASPATVPSDRVGTVPGQIAGNNASAAEGGGFGCASNFSAWCSKGMPLSVGYGSVVRHGRPCWHGRSSRVSSGIASSLATWSFATWSSGVAGCELMPSGRGVAGAVAFPRPRTSGSSTAWTDGTNAMPRGRSPTTKCRSAGTIAACVATSVEAAIGTAVETSTAAGMRASTTARMTTAMLGERGC
jgi:hypothetical protein